ncbi:protein Shroom isoform X2 [Athalia rosae]|uniref:protein Shroom isoform X2 n=1 Tax=Athalia rosae TaxID=37344 RepID=UPI002034587A|nr:protein Shroom isoform X2 [Athalia rosae]
MIKRGVNGAGGEGVEKSLPRLTYASQNLYCSLPREHGRQFHQQNVTVGSSGSRKISKTSNGHTEATGQNPPRPRSNSANFYGVKSPQISMQTSSTATVLKRGGPAYSSDGKSIKRRNQRDRRRHSLNEILQDDNRTTTSSRVKEKRCIPDGGDVGRTMTDLQPSSPGYRGQDEPPGPARSPSAATTFSYSTHGHTAVGTENSPYKNSTPYSTEGYGKQNSSPPSSASPNSPSRTSGTQLQNDFYHIHKNNDAQINRNEREIVSKKNSIITGYNDGYKKNTPGYKNDSGYSESSGFGSYSLPLSERDEASPPPTPPVRDASSLKGVCYGPGHEKYPSWPTAPEHHSPEEEVIHAASSHGGSHRSKSWTDHTTYPKEKPAQYTRPHTKRPNPAFTQQLKTVMERCEKIPAETYEARNRSNVESATESRLWPRVDREGKSLGDVEYVAPSPPEREQQQPPQTLSHADLEAYVRSYQDPQVGQVDLYQESNLTQAGLEEYARVQHSQQASYAQSEGYHSYVSSVDSTTNTPFLDRLRRDSEAVAQRPTSSWDDAREGRDSVVTTSSGSASSSETLKWHGSMSDVSVASGLPARQSGIPEKWHHGSMSDVSIGAPTHKQSNSHDKWQGSLGDVSTAGVVPPVKARHCDKWQENWQNSMNDRNKRGVRNGLPIVGHGSNGDVCATPTSREGGNWQESSIDDEETRPRDREGNNDVWNDSVGNERGIVDEKYNNSLNQPMPQSPTHTQHVVGIGAPRSPENWNSHHGSMSDLSANGPQGSKQLIAHSARVQTPQRHHSESVLYLDRERNQRKLYPVGNQQAQETGLPSRVTPTSPQQPQLSVAERISELEKQQLQQQMRYTYLDPDKRHRVSDPTLKAIQKKALLSFYERHHQASWRSEPQLAQGSATPAPQSPPPQPPPRPRPPSSRRASSASDYASGGTWREKSSRNSNVADPPSPKHQHSNSCGSLSTDLLGPVIVGPAISIDDWVPERPPKKPHLRNVYNDRVPSPDLPPPSPPTVTELEVINFDDPLPPPPSELQSDAYNSQENKENSHGIIEDKRRDHGLERHKSQQPERQSTRRSTKHGQKREHDKSSKSSPAKNHQGDRNNFVRSTTVAKHADSGMIVENGVSAGFATHRMVATGRSSLRYPSTQKLMVNGRVAPAARRVTEERLLFPARPPAQLPDLISQRYSDSGNQRPAPQVPVEPRIIRQESMRVESTRIDASGLLRNDSQRLESSSGQRPQPQVPTSESKGPAQPPPRPNYLPLQPDAGGGKSSKYAESNHNFTLSSPIKTSYEASSKLFAEGSPQKYHEPPKYVPNSQRHAENGPRNYYALPPKYTDAPIGQKPQSQAPVDRYACGSPSSPPPPPLAPRQNTPGRKSLPPPPRPAPPHAQQGSQSKASYLAYRRERGAPDSEGSYKRTMSPTAHVDDWPPNLRDNDDPVLLRVTPRHSHALNNSEHQQQQQQQQLLKSHSVDALHHRLEERTAHSVEVIGKLSYDLSKKLQASEVRSASVNRGENNVIGNNNNNNNNLEQNQIGVESVERKERISPQSIEVLNDRNRQLERERRKLAASCELSNSMGQMRSNEKEILLAKCENNYQRERSATIEMTSRNVELLNRRNAGGEKCRSQPLIESVRETREKLNFDTRPPPVIEKPPPPTTSPPRTPDLVERRQSSPSSNRSGAVPRRSGSCSSSSSSSLKSLNSRNSNTLPSRSSPKVSGRRGNDSPNSRVDSSPSTSPCSDSCNFIVEHISISSRRKVSSPTQTDDAENFRPSRDEIFLSNSVSPIEQYSPNNTRSSQTTGSSFENVKNSRSSTGSPDSSPSTPTSPTSLKNPLNNITVNTGNDSPCVSPQPGIEGLTLVQRTEIVLRVNAATSDAASQTELLSDDEPSRENRPDADQSQVQPEPRKKSPEEIECEELSRDLASQLSPNDKLVPILVPVPEHKRPTDYVTGLFRVEATLQPRPARRRLSISRSDDTIPTTNCSGSNGNKSENNKTETLSSPISSPEISTVVADPTSPLSPTSAYFTTSEGKARFLTRYSRDVTEDSVLPSSHGNDASGVPTPTANNVANNQDLKQKKRRSSSSAWTESSSSFEPNRKPFEKKAT